MTDLVFPNTAIPQNFLELLLLPNKEIFKLIKANL